MTTTPKMEIKMNREDDRDDINALTPGNERPFTRSHPIQDAFSILGISMQLAGYQLLICLLIVIEPPVSAVSFLVRQGRRHMPAHRHRQVDEVESEHTNSHQPGS